MSCPPLTNKGGKLSISRFPVPCELTLPELAQLDYVVVPGVGSIGDTGIEQEISSYSTTNAGVSPQSKGAAVGKAWDVEMLESQSEARDILEAASAVGNKDTYATRIEWPDGVVEFSIVQVSSPTYVKGAPSGVRIVRYTMVPSFVPIVKNPLQAPVLYAPTYDAPDTVVLNWFDLSSIEDGVHVYASYSKIDVNALPPPTATLAPNTVQYDYAFDMGEVLEERLYFRVAAFNSDAVKVSNEVSIGNPANVLYSESPTWLFANAEVGYANTLGIDTLYTDTAGTTPVAEYGDTIALATNLAPNGPDMVQATAAARPVYGRMPVSGVVNQAEYSEDFSNAWWQKVNGAITSEGDTIAGLPAQRFTLSGGSAQHRITRNTFWPAGQANCLAWFVVDVSGMTTKSATINIAQPNSTGRFDWTGPQTISTTGSSGDGTQGYVILGDYQALIWHCAPDARSSAGGMSLFFGAYGSYEGDGEYGIVARGQLEFGATAPSDYQRVGAAYDITQEGIPSVPIAYSDTSDDNWSWDLAAGTYHIFVAGERGCYFDTVVHAGGAFTVGPTTWTGGPAGAVTNLIGQRYVLVPEYRKDEPFTQFEREQMVAYAMARGCPGVWNRSAELFTGTITVGEGWTDNGNGSYTKVATENVSSLVTANSVAAGEVFDCRWTQANRTAGSSRVFASGNAITANYASNGTWREIGIAPAAGSLAMSGTSPFDGTVSNISIRKLTLESTPA